MVTPTAASGRWCWGWSQAERRTEAYEDEEHHKQAKPLVSSPGRVLPCPLAASCPPHGTRARFAAAGVRGREGIRRGRISRAVQSRARQRLRHQRDGAWLRAREAWHGWGAADERNLARGCCRQRGTRCCCGRGACSKSALFGSFGGCSEGLGWPNCCGGHPEGRLLRQSFVSPRLGVPCLAVPPSSDAPAPPAVASGPG